MNNGNYGPFIEASYTQIVSVVDFKGQITI